MENCKTLEIFKTNKFGDNCYIPSVKGNINLPLDNDFWTIKNPTQNIINHYPNCQVRKYNNDIYLLSSKAGNILSPSKITFGCAAILYFIYNGNRYFILVVDNKKYLQNSQGGSNQNETPIDVIIREVYEELNIKLNPSQCKEYGGWKFSKYNQLVETQFNNTTYLFSIQVSYEQVKHLIQKELNPNQLNIFSVEKYDFKLDETEYVIFISEDFIMEAPEKIDLIKQGITVTHTFDGHHREAILRYLNKTKYNINYLKEFYIYS